MRAEPEKTTRRTGAREPRAAMRKFIAPCDPAQREKAPSGPDWIYEIKVDGYRAQVHLHDGKVTIYSRSGHDWTEQFRAIAEAVLSLDVRHAILDGEVAVLGSSGRPDFQELRRELGKPRSSRLLYHAFDLLNLDGVDLRPSPLIERKQALKQLLAGAPASLVYVEHLESDGQRVFEHACRLGLEGIVAKRRDSPYRSGLQESWVKLKCVQSATLPIVAFVEKLGARPRRIASLYIGRREGDRLLYAGKASTGYTLDTAEDLRERLDPLITKQSPLSTKVKKPKATWVEPALAAEIEFGGSTQDGLLRAPVFKGLRDDLGEAAPKVVVQPKRRAERGLGVSRENILQLLPDAVAPPPDELKAYWRKVAPKALEHLARRPLKLVRNVHGTIFYHKGPLPPVPDTVHRLQVRKREGGEGVRLWVDDLEGLLGLVDIGAVELHPWNATVDDIERADRIVLDLDPGQGVGWDEVVQTALAVRDLLQQEGLDTWPKLTGSKGMHVMAPLTMPLTHDAARIHARELVQRLVSAMPEKYVLSSDPSARTGRIFLDYLRNGRGNTAAGAYSPRVRPGFPIAAPVTWKQVEQGIRPDAFTMKSPFRPRRT